MTARLEFNPLLGRKARAESWEEQGVSSLAETRRAIREGTPAEAREMLDNYLAEMRWLYDGYLAWVRDWIVEIGRHDASSLWDDLEHGWKHLAHLNLTTLPLEIADVTVASVASDIEIVDGSSLRHRATGARIALSAWLQVGAEAETTLRSAIAAGDRAGALPNLELLHRQHKPVHDAFSDWLWLWMTRLADRWGEDAMYALMMDSGTRLRTAGLRALPRISVEEQVRMMAAAMRGHRSGPGEEGDVRVIEDPEKFVIEFDACGSGGRMRRRGEIDGLPARQDEPFRFGVARKAGPMSWGRESVPYYCTHCAAYAEIMSTDLIGYPSRVTRFNPDGTKPCAWAFYKKPEDIPEEYFTRIGRTRDPSRFAKP